MLLLHELGGQAGWFFSSAVVSCKEQVQDCLEVSQQHRDHITKSPGTSSTLPMILSEALQASAKRVVLE